MMFSVLLFNVVRLLFYVKAVGCLRQSRQRDGRILRFSSSLCTFYLMFAFLSRRLLSTTLTLLNAIRAAAHIGVIWNWLTP